jgi:hypothetical protein
MHVVDIKARGKYWQYDLSSYVGKKICTASHIVTVMQEDM